MQDVSVSSFEAVVQVYSDVIEHARRRRVTLGLSHRRVRVEVLRFRARVTSENYRQGPAISAYLTVLIYCTIRRSSVTLETWSIIKIGSVVNCQGIFFIKAISNPNDRIIESFEILIVDHSLIWPPE